MNTRFPARPHASRGFTLLEALVTVVIVSIGLLGILGLQTVSIANTASSSARSDATIAADNLADRMRVNFTGARDGAYEDINNPSAGNTDGPDECTLQKPCNPAALADRDAWEWDRQISESLPSGAGHVSCEEKVGGECVSYLITVLWSERDPERNSAQAPEIAQCEAENAMVSGCFQTVVRP